MILSGVSFISSRFSILCRLLILGLAPEKTINQVNQVKTLNAVVPYFNPLINHGILWLKGDLVLYLCTVQVVIDLFVLRKY